jgi:hypothetical protein
MKISRAVASLATAVTLTCAAVAVIATQRGTVGATDDHVHATDSSKVDLGMIREATKRFQDVKVAEKEGYGQFLGCVSGPNGGAMGIHFANGALVGDGELDLLKPEVLIYEPDGEKLKLVGMEYVVIAEGWHAKNPNPPVLAGQSFHYAVSPNRYGMPAHYELHVWAWRGNPTGTFADWNPKVLCGE